MELRPSRRRHLPPDQAHALLCTYTLFNVSPSNLLCQLWQLHTALSAVSDTLPTVLLDSVQSLLGFLRMRKPTPVYSGKRHDSICSSAQPPTPQNIRGRPCGWRGQVMRRPQIFGRGQALNGDWTTTGANLISTIPSNATTDRRGMVRRGDPTTVCPKCGKAGLVAEGEARFNLLGKPIALDGHLVNCSCPVGSNRIVAPLGILSTDTTKCTYVETGNPIASLAQRPTKKQFDLQFLLTDSNNGKPKPYTPYQITMETGTVIRGVSDESGLTKKIFADSPLKATIEAPSYEPAELTYTCTDVCQH